MSYLIPIFYLTAYAILHSVFAMDRAKAHLYRLIPQRYYRLIYSILSIILLIPIRFLPWPLGHLYHVTAPTSYLLYLTQLMGIIGFLWTLRHTAMGDFLGWAHLKKTSESAQLITTGPYRLCRHPLYFFGSIIFIAHPHMTASHLILTLWIVFYFWIGSYIEEKRLIQQFGNTYIAYQTTTPRLIPFL